MNGLKISSIVLLSALVLVSSIECDRRDYSPEQLKALTRDDNGRADPDELSLGVGRGSFAAWPVLLFVMAAAMALFSLLGAIEHVTGLCRQPANYQEPTEA